MRSEKPRRPVRLRGGSHLPGITVAAAICAIPLTFGVLLSQIIGPLPDTWRNDYGTLTQTMRSPMDGVNIGVYKDCFIREFGRAPWRAFGQPRDEAWEVKTRFALVAMGVPAEAIPGAIAAMRRGPQGQLGMSNLDGTDMLVKYEPTFTTTYTKDGRNGVCLNSRTRFATNDQREVADIYRINHRGEWYILGEFRACGNVSRFYPSMPELPMPDPMPGAVRPGPGAVGPIGPAPAPFPYFAPPKVVEAPKEVPEPGTWALVALAAAFVIVLPKL